MYEVLGFAAKEQKEPEAKGQMEPETESATVGGTDGEAPQNPADA
jgi:hypothetical protein